MNVSYLKSQRTPSAFIEISPLFETHWSGIPTVAAGIVREALKDQSIDWRFFFQSLEIDSEIVRNMILNNSGNGGYQNLHHIAWEKVDINPEAVSKCKALFLNMKTIRGMFGKEAMFIHDLTPLITPSFHNSDSRSHFADRIRADIQSSQRFFCNSESTRNDLVAYLNVDRDATCVVPLGVEIDVGDLSVAQALGQKNNIEPYVVVIGTLEPRKNGRIVFDHLMRDPGFSDRFRILFVGREGWLEERSELRAAIARAGVSPDRIIFTGFVSDLEKTAIIKNAAFCIYPSYYEGFGLPILEAASLSKLVVCSNTSSMVEIAPKLCSFFNPLDSLDFTRAIKVAEQRFRQILSSQVLTDAMDKLASVSWESCYAAISRWIKV